MVWVYPRRSWRKSSTNSTAEAINVGSLGVLGWVWPSANPLFWLTAGVYGPRVKSDVVPHSTLDCRLPIGTKKTEASDFMPKKVKVLVADDEPKILMFVRANLEARGYEGSLAQDGVEAVEIAGRVSPDVIVLDVNMPRMDGIE